jgi:hypothetical protein
MLYWTEWGSEKFTRSPPKSWALEVFLNLPRQPFGFAIALPDAVQMDLEKLIRFVGSLDFSNGLDNSFMNALDDALSLARDGNENNVGSIIGNLRDFIARVEAARGKEIDEADPDLMIEDAQFIIDVFQAI